MKRISVVLVDDDALVLSALCRVLQIASAHVRTAHSAEAALALLEEQVPEFVISDWRMPGMDGAALLAKIQRRHPQVRCALLTGEPPEVTRGLAWPILRKPCGPEELLAWIRRPTGAEGGAVERPPPAPARPPEEDPAAARKEGRRSVGFWAQELALRERARRVIRLAYERRFGPIPPSVEAAVVKTDALEDLEQIMDVCLTRPLDELEQVLGLRAN